jgi:hypothetical protein
MTELQLSKGASLADRAGALHERIREMTAELDLLKEELAPLAEFKNGSQTGHLTGTRWTVTVQKKENVKWSQDALKALRLKMGDEEFFKVFTFEYGPESKKTSDGAIAFGAFGKDISEARTVTEGKPYVSFKRMEDC